MVELPAWAEIDLNALSHNIKEMRRITPPEAGIMAVVKANAYGHGSLEVSRVALANGAVRLAVARTAEGAELRRGNIEEPVLILGYTPVGLIREVSEYGLEQTVFGFEYAKEVNSEALRLGVRIPVHIKVDTGMGRLGVVTEQETSIDEIIKIASLPNLEAVGIFTHFASADSADKHFANQQLEKFNRLLDQLKRKEIEFPIVHCANSAAIIDMPNSGFNLVRTGISMYGLYPSEEVNAERITLKPVMSFKARIAQVKSVPAGFSVSYGCTYKTLRDTVIATLPVGYADGYSRLLSSRGEVLVRGKRAPVVGRVCMDQCIIDVGNVSEVFPGEEVVLFGRQGNAVLPVEDIAAWIGTINYEVVCMVGSRVPRIYKR